MNTINGIFMFFIYLNLLGIFSPTKVYNTNNTKQDKKGKIANSFEKLFKKINYTESRSLMTEAN